METFTFVKVENEDCITELLACRVCLATDVRLIDLHKNGLANLFGDVTGTQVLKTDGLPQVICSICVFLLKKSFTFRAKCRKVHILLQDSRVNQPLMTTAFIKTLDRTHLKLPLTYTNAINLDFSPENNSPQNKNETNPVVKSEPSINSGEDDISDDWTESNDGINYEFVDIPEALEEKHKHEEKADIKHSETNEDAETIIEIYANQPKIKEKVDKTRKKINKKLPPKKKNQTPKPLKEKVKKKKRQFNRKFEEDFVGFAESYNCEVVFLTKEQQLKEVEDMKESSEFKKARFKCNICFKGFMNVSAHTKHMKTHDKIFLEQWLQYSCSKRTNLTHHASVSGDHICDICFARFPVRRILLNHLRTHKKRFICKICDHVSKVSTLAKAHYKWHEGFKYECKPCNKQFNTMSTYLNHKRQLHASVTCQICEEKVSGTKGLEEHNEKVHSTKYPCERCRKQFDSEEAFNRHLSPGCVCIQNNCPCTSCGENFASKQLLYDHRETVHAETLYRCDECPEAYTTGRLLAAHWHFKHAKSSFMCEICARSYKSASALRTHQRVHTGDRPHRSTKEFCIEDSLQGNLRNSQRDDSEERRFQCPMCPKRFKQNTNLKVHINTHTGARPYKCTQCDEAFKSYSQKYKHSLMVHKKERRYKCHMCEKAYVVSSDLKMHIRTFHMKIPRPPPNRRKNRNNKVI